MQPIVSAENSPNRTIAGRGSSGHLSILKLPHAGTDSRIWREIVRLGQDLAAPAPIRRSRVVADIAMVRDWRPC